MFTQGGRRIRLIIRKLDLDTICDAFRMVSRIIFRIFTSEFTSGGICDAFRIFGCGGKKINIKTGGLPPALWFRF